MRGIIRTLALGAVLAASAATGAMAQGINNTGYSRSYYGDNSYSAPPAGYYGNNAYSNTWYDRQGYAGYHYAPAPTYNYAPAPTYSYVPGTAYAPGPGGGDSYGSSSSYGTGGWDNGRPGPSQQAPWGYGGEYGYNAGFRSPSKY